MARKKVVSEDTPEKADNASELNEIFAKEEADTKPETLSVNNDDSAATVPQGSSPRKSRSTVLRQNKIEAKAKEVSIAQESAFLSGLAQLETARKTNRILYGTVTGVEERTIPNAKDEINKTAIFLIVMYNNQYRIIVPFADFYRKFPIDMSTVNLESETGVKAFLNRQRAMAEKLYGVEIPFVVSHVDVNKNDIKDYAIVASRSTAIDRISKHNFGTARSGRGVIKEGDTVDGRVISVGSYSVQINVGGVDVALGVRQLTFKYIASPGDVANLYHVNDIIPVKVRSVSRDSDGTINLEVSAKIAELERICANDIEPPVNTSTIGTITFLAPSRSKNNAVNISLYLDYFGRPAISNGFEPSRFGRSPVPGDKVRVDILGTDPSGMVRVRCRQIHDALDFVSR